MLSLTVTNKLAGVGGRASSVLVRKVTVVGMSVTVVSPVVVVRVSTTQVKVRITTGTIRADPLLPTAKCSFIAL